jgi:hypothetical protein
MTSSMNRRYSCRSGCIGTWATKRMYAERALPLISGLSFSRPRSHFAKCGDSQTSPSCSRPGSNPSSCCGTIDICRVSFRPDCAATLWVPHGQLAASRHPCPIRRSESAALRRDPYAQEEDSRYRKYAIHDCVKQTGRYSAAVRSPAFRGAPPPGIISRPVRRSRTRICGAWTRAHENGRAALLRGD